MPLLGNIQAKYGHHVSADRLARRLRQQAENLGELSTVFRCDDGDQPRGFALTAVAGLRSSMDGSVPWSMPFHRCQAAVRA